MPELGKYTEAVIGSYSATIGLIAVLLVVSVMRSRKTRRELQAVEKKAKDNG